MKLGIFSDVHGHLQELHQTLNLFKKLQVDSVICCGDLVDKGQYSEAVVQIMVEQSIPCVQGNHDFKVQFTCFTKEEQLSYSTVDYLRQLPTSLKYCWAGISVFVCHANPWQDSSVYVFPDRPSALFDEVISTVASQVIIMGHTHHPMCIQYKDRWLLNAGSIYGNRDRDERTCAVLELPNMIFKLYDIDTGNSLKV